MQYSRNMKMKGWDITENHNKDFWGLYLEKARRPQLFPRKNRGYCEDLERLSGFGRLTEE